MYKDLCFEKREGGHQQVQEKPGTHAKIQQIVNGDKETRDSLAMNPVYLYQILMKVENNNVIKPSFLTVAWLFFTVIAVVTYLAKFDAGSVGIFSWVVCIGGLIIALLVKILWG